MLILTRKPGESVYIGDDVKVTLMEIKGNQVRIGVDAPASVRIYREEIYLQILEENKLAADLPEVTDLQAVQSAWKGQKEKSLGKLKVSKKKSGKKDSSSD